jgi:bifunctional non-homologous end joining protein LigD
MSLGAYRRKRHFDRTPEPAGAVAGGAGPLRFVVQKHEASRLHFDFRLEAGGVLKSWAVPKGPSLDPATKRLAVMVEDHPLDYRTFEGTIPTGNYGAGTVMLWDEGTFHTTGGSSRRETERAVAEGLRGGRLSFVLEGRKLRGEFSLVKLRRGANDWLLVKKKDAFASADGHEDDRSVASGRSMAEIAAGTKAKRRRTKTKVDASAPRPARRRRPAERFVRPMLATLVGEPFDRPGWFFEVKWDGYRAIADIRDGEVRLYSRNQKSFASTFAPVVEALAGLSRDTILDGEVVVLDAQGRSQFQLLQQYKKTRRGQLVYYAFDLLELDGRDLRSEPLAERKRLLAGLVDAAGVVRLSDHVERDGAAFFAAAATQGLEGIIAKDARSPYREGERGPEWLKVKTHLRQEAVIAGYTRPRGGRKDLGALILGVYEGGELTYIGHTGGGFDTKGLAAMRGRLEPLRRPRCPFPRCPRTNMPATWVAPELVCEVRFQGWTDDGRMRQPIFLGLREDKPARAIRRERPAPLPLVAAARPQRCRGQNLAPTPGPAREAPSVAVSNPDKLYWPDEGITKSALIDYYRAVAPVILPYLRDRPESLHRHPNGITGPSFFQKDVSRQRPPAWVATVALAPESGKRLVAPLCQDEASLLYLANLGCIELNPWNSRTGSLDRPDYLVIDLDPEAIPFARVVEAASAVRRELDRAGAACYCKTSGKTGLHVYVPLGARYDYDLARRFAELVANLVNGKLPGSTSVVRSPAKRQGRVYLDFLQNRKGQTLAAAYAARPHPGATVSTPLKWSEVTRRLDPGRFTIRTIPKRLDKVGDLWTPVLGEGVDLEACVTRLASRW